MLLIKEHSSNIVFCPLYNVPTFHHGAIQEKGSGGSMAKWSEHWACNLEIPGIVIIIIIENDIIHIYF